MPWSIVLNGEPNLTCFGWWGKPEHLEEPTEIWGEHADSTLKGPGQPGFEPRNFLLWGHCVVELVSPSIMYNKNVRSSSYYIAAVSVAMFGIEQELNSKDGYCTVAYIVMTQAMLTFITGEKNSMYSTMQQKSPSFLQCKSCFSNDKSQQTNNTIWLCEHKCS